MWFRLLSYLKFYVNAGNKHTIHSPFIFKFYTNGLLKKPDADLYKRIKAIRKTIIADKSIIQVQDFGKGSTIFNGNHRQVSKIGRIAGINLKKTKKLAQLISLYKPATILEIGTSVGLATSCMSLSNNQCQIYTIEGCVNTAAIAQSVFKTHHLNNINLFIGKFEDVLPRLVTDQTFDLIYFDGNHDKEATLNYFEICLPATHDNTILIFDDIYWSSEMSSAWEILTTHPKVTASMNTYFWGILFLNKDLSKQHFKLKC